MPDWVFVQSTSQVRTPLKKWMSSSSCVMESAGWARTCGVRLIAMELSARKWVREAGAVTGDSEKDEILRARVHQAHNLIDVLLRYVLHDVHAV